MVAAPRPLRHGDGTTRLNCTEGGTGQECGADAAGGGEVLPLSRVRDRGQEGEGSSPLPALAEGG
jgi:hypothetical protein